MRKNNTTKTKHTQVHKHAHKHTKGGTHILEFVLLPAHIPEAVVSAGLPIEIIVLMAKNRQTTGGEKG